MDSAQFPGHNRKFTVPRSAAPPVATSVSPFGAEFVQKQSQDDLWSSFDSTSEDEKGLDVWGFLMRRKAFIIALALLGAGIGYLYYRRQDPRYSSTASLQVIHHGTDPRVENLLAEKSLSDAQFEVTSRKLLEPCLQTIGETEVLRGLDLEDDHDRDTAVRRIAGMVTARSVSANILHLSCESSNPKDTMIIANAVAEAYKAHQEGNYRDAVAQLEALLNDATVDLQVKLSKAEEAYRIWDEDSPLDSRGENPHTKRLVGIQEKMQGYVIRRTEIMAELADLEEAMKSEDQRDALLLLLAKRDPTRKSPIPNVPDNLDDSDQNMFDTLFPLLMEEAMLAEELGPEHPKLKALRQRIKLTEKQFEALAGRTAQRKEELEEDVVEEPVVVDFLDVYVKSLKQDLSRTERAHSELQRLAEFEESEAKSLRKFEHMRRDKEREIQRLTSVLSDVQQQITELPTNQLGGVTATIMNEARLGRLVYPMPAQFLGFGAFFGAFVGLILGYIVEAADRSFRKPDEIIREFGIPIVGHVPYIQEQKLRKVRKDTIVDRTIVSLHQPRSRASEAYRSVRTAVCFSTQGGTHRVIQVTSPAAGDGKSTLACNFAVSLAQSGKSTVIIESDFRRPKVHKLTGVDNEIGVVDVLRGTCELPDAIQSTEQENFSVIPCGTRPKNPSELLARPEYEQLIEMLREKFEYVIIDTPPVLVVTDPCSVAPRADGVLLCVRLSRHTRDLGRRSLEQLRDVGARMSGIVINGVDESDAYGYGNYSYSDYRYRYKDYGYSYGYGDKQNEAYFAETESEAETETEEASA